MKLKTNIIMCAGLLALTACSDWNREAGAKLDEGGFGNPIMNNMLAQMCRGQAKGYIVPDPVVGLDPSSPKAAPVYRQGKVMCSGDLNGKYARVIWGGYVASAVPPTQIDGGLSDIGGGEG